MPGQSRLAEGKQVGQNANSVCKEEVCLECSLTLIIGRRLTLCGAAQQQDQARTPHTHWSIQVEAAKVLSMRDGMHTAAPEKRAQAYEQVLVTILTKKSKVVQAEHPSC